MVAEYDQNGNLVAKYHHDGGGLMAMTRNNSSYWYGFEAIGTARQLMDGQGQVSDTYAFDAWGNELTSPQSQVPNPFRYVGKHGYYLDTESALMLLGIRYYGAFNGLFLSRDLIEGYGYTYAADNPVRWLDPQGLQSSSEHCNIVNGQRECASSDKGGGKGGRLRESDVYVCYRGGVFNIPDLCHWYFWIDNPNQGKKGEVDGKDFTCGVNRQSKGDPICVCVPDPHTKPRPGDFYECKKIYTSIDPSAFKSCIKKHCYALAGKCVPYNPFGFNCAAFVTGLTQHCDRLAQPEGGWRSREHFGSRWWKFFSRLCPKGGKPPCEFRVQ